MILLWGLACRFPQAGTCRSSSGIELTPIHVGDLRLYVATTEVTQASWLAISRDLLPVEGALDEADYLGLDARAHLLGPDRPVVGVDLVHALRFANQLSAAEGLDEVYSWAWLDPDEFPRWDRRADGWRIPTYEEWVALRQASEHPASTPCGRGDVLDRSFVAAGGRSSRHADCDDGWPGLSPVGRFGLDTLGLADLRGGAGEWAWGDPPGGWWVCGESWLHVPGETPAPECHIQDPRRGGAADGLRLVRDRGAAGVRCGGPGE